MTKYFSVEKEVVYIKDVCRWPVYKDGEKSGEHYYVENGGYPDNLTIGFVVNIYGEEGYLEGVEFYSVKTDMDDFTNNELEVLKQIEAEHPAGEWQNNEW